VGRLHRLGADGAQLVADRVGVTSSRSCAPKRSSVRAASYLLQ